MRFNRRVALGMSLARATGMPSNHFVGDKRDASRIFPVNSKPIDSPIKTAGHTFALTPLPKISSAVWVF
jgi:hypothetical protein